jgi:hypothetical protein
MIYQQNGSKLWIFGDTGMKRLHMLSVKFIHSRRGAGCSHLGLDREHKMRSPRKRYFPFWKAWGLGETHSLYHFCYFPSWVLDWELTRSQGLESEISFRHEVGVWAEGGWGRRCQKRRPTWFAPLFPIPDSFLILSKSPWRLLCINQ